MRSTPRLRTTTSPFSNTTGSSMHISDFDYELPPELIAQEPARPRDTSRMMFVDRQTGTFSDVMFRDLPNLLRPDDVLVFNDTRVMKARLYGEVSSPTATK